MQTEEVTQLADSDRPLAELLKLAGPTIAQMASYTVMQFIDTWMLARLGDVAPTAAGNAGIFAFAVISFGMGVLFVVNALVSQKFGHRHFASCGQSMWQGMWFSLGYSVLLLPVLPVVSRTFELFGHSAELVKLETEYLQIVLGMTVFKMVGTAASQFLLGTNRPNAVLIAAVTAVSVNVVAAMALVLGKFGFASHGVVGSAWAQNIGVFTEMCVLLAFAFSRRAREQYGAMDWRFRRGEFRVLLGTGFGSGVQILAEVLAWSLFLNLVIGRLGEKAMAANQLMFRYMAISFMPAFGVAQAVTTLVGRYIGAGRPDVSMRRAHLGFAVAAGYMMCCAAVYVLARQRLIQMILPDPEVVRLGATLMVFAGAYQFFDAMYVIYNGALRGAGDTFMPAVMTASLNWGLSVGGGWLIVRFIPQSGIVGPWIAALTYGVILGIYLMRRFIRGEWKSIHLEADSNMENSLDRVSVVRCEC